MAEGVRELVGVLVLVVVGVRVVDSEGTCGSGEEVGLPVLVADGSLVSDTDFVAVRERDPTRDAEMEEEGEGVSEGRTKVGEGVTDPERDRVPLPEEVIVLVADREGDGERVAERERVPVAV